MLAISKKPNKTSQNPITCIEFQKKNQEVLHSGQQQNHINIIAKYDVTTNLKLMTASEITRHKHYTDSYHCYVG